MTICCLLFQLVVAEVANKFAQSHFGRGVRDTNVRLLTKVVVQYIDRQVSWDKLQAILLKGLYRKYCIPNRHILHSG